MLATGATERPIAFARNDRPGVMLASAAAAYVERFGVLVDDRVSLLTTNESALSGARASSSRAGETRAVVDPAIDPAR